MGPGVRHWYYKSRKRADCAVLWGVVPSPDGVSHPIYVGEHWGRGRRGRYLDTGDGPIPENRMRNSNILVRFLQRSLATAEAWFEVLGDVLVTWDTQCTFTTVVCFKKGVSGATASHLPKNRKSQKKILKSLTNLIVISHNLKPVKISYAKGRVSVRIFYKNNLIRFYLLTLLTLLTL